MSKNYLQKLNYKIVHFSSSEDDEAKLREPIISFKNNWISERFCSYPQQIIIQFNTPVNLRLINIISHEKKISEKISLYSFCPQKDIFIPDSNGLNFENIGFINFNQNFASNYQVRELKRIFINLKCLYLKFLLDKNYINDYNPYHQVGLINIDFYGLKLPGYNNIINKTLNINPHDEKIKDNKNEENNINNDSLYEINGEKVKELNKKLMESNKIKNIKDCRQYKESISKAKELGIKIYNLQQEKNEVIKIEDYDKATELKENIDNLKSQLYSLGEKSPIRNSSLDNINSENNLDNNNINNNIINNEGENNLDTQNLLNTKNNTKNNSFFLSNNNSKSFESYNKQNSPTYFSSTKNKDSENEKENYDEMVIPALKKKEKSQKELDLENEELYKLGLGPLEELEQEKIGNYSVLIPFIEELGLQKLLSNQIYYKVEGIKLIINVLSKIFISSELNDIIPVLFELISNFLEEKNNIITKKIFELIEQIFLYMNVNLDKIIISKQLLYFINTRIIHKIIGSLSNGVEIIRTKATELYIHIIYQNVIKFKLLIYYLLNKDIKNKDNEHYNISSICVLCKLAILKKVLYNYSKIIEDNIATEETFPKDLIIEFLLININNPKNNIKDKCREILIKTYELFGPETFKDKLSYLTKKEYEKLFKIKTLQPMMKSISTTSLEDSNNLPKSSINNSPRKYKKIKNENLCLLCRKPLEEEILTEHMKKCPLCCRCKKCKIFVEVKNLTNHKLNDCKYKNEYKLCPRCKEAIHIKSYKNHLENRKCNPNKANYLRCPLCHVDIPPSNKGFFHHLINNGCPVRSQINNSTEAGV